MNTKQPSKQRVWLRWTVIFLVIILAGWLAWSGWSAFNHARSLQEQLPVLEALADPSKLADFQPADLAGLQTKIIAFDDEVQGLARAARPFAVLAPLLSWLPKVGPEMSQAQPLLELASNASTAARLSWDGLTPALNAWQDKNSGPLTERLVPALKAGAPSFDQARVHLAAAAEARAKLQTSGFSTRSQQLIARFDKLLPLLATVAEGGALAPTLLGADGPRTYLLLAQNSDELRATGGFISGVGLLRLDGGKIMAEMQDAYSVEDWSIPHPEAPAALLKYMKAEVLAIRDANWSPDFPTTAASVQKLYKLNRGMATDGVIAFNISFAQNLVAALQPLALPGYREPLTSANVMQAMRTVWSQPASTDGNVTPESGSNSDWWQHRKDFMADLMKAVLTKAQSGDAKPGPLLFALKEGFDQRNLLISVEDADAENLLAVRGWNGQISPQNGDFLMLVDSNVGWNKVNSRIDQAAQYNLTFAEDGSAQAELLVSYTHTSQTPLSTCIHESRYGFAYEDMMERCYFDYVRVLAPLGASLRSLDGVEPNSTEILTETSNVSTFAGFLIVPTKSTRQLRVAYELPRSVVENGQYTLRVQKQAGARAWPLRVEVRTPSAWEIAAESPDASVSDGVLVWQTTLDQDRVLQLTGFAAAR